MSNLQKDLKMLKGQSLTHSIQCHNCSCSSQIAHKAILLMPAIFIQKFPLKRLSANVMKYPQISLLTNRIRGMCFVEEGGFAYFGNLLKFPCKEKSCVYTRGRHKIANTGM